MGGMFYCHEWMAIERARTTNIVPPIYEKSSGNTVRQIKQRGEARAYAYQRRVGTRLRQEANRGERFLVRP